MNEQEMLAALAALIASAYGMQMDFAMIEGVHAGALSRMLSGQKVVTDKVLEVLALERCVRYRDRDRDMFINPERVLAYARQKIKRQYGTQTELARQLNTGVWGLNAHLHGRGSAKLPEWVLDAVNIERVQTYRRAKPAKRSKA